MDRCAFLFTNRALLVDGVAEHIHDAAQSLCTDWHRDGRPRIFDIEASAHTLGRAHRDSANHAVAQLLLHFKRQAFVAHHQCVIHLRHAIPGKLHIDDGANNLYDLSATHFTVLVSKPGQQPRRCLNPITQ